MTDKEIAMNLTVALINKKLDAPSVDYVCETYSTIYEAVYKNQPVNFK